MRIGIDVSQTGQGKAGCGYVADSLARSLMRQFPDDEFILLPNFGDLVWDDAWPRTTVQPEGAHALRGPTFNDHGACQRFWRTPPADLDAALGRPDIVHSHNFFCPQGLSRARLVYTLHDLSFVENPDWTTEANRVHCFDGCFQAALRADAVVAVSEFSRRHFLEVFPHYPADRTRTVHLGSRFHAGSPAAKPQRLAQLAPDGYWLAVGTIEPRKNYEGLVRAYAAASARHPSLPPLVMVGKEGWLMERFPGLLAELGIADKVLFAGYVDDAELVWLYRHCRGFLYPSHWEGFGLPVLEALSQGAAVVTSTTSSLPEVLGGAGLAVAPTDIPGLADAILRMETEPGLRDRFRAAAPAQAARFDWDASARTLRALYDELLARPRFAEEAVTPAEPVAAG